MRAVAFACALGAQVYRLLVCVPDQVGEQSERGDEELRREVAQLAERRFLRTQAVVQDLSDSLLAIADIRGEEKQNSNFIV